MSPGRMAGTTSAFDRSARRPAQLGLTGCHDRARRRGAGAAAGAPRRAGLEPRGGGRGPAFRRARSAPRAAAGAPGDAVEVLAPVPSRRCPGPAGTARAGRGRRRSCPRSRSPARRGGDPPASRTWCRRVYARADTASRRPHAIICVDGIPSGHGGRSRPPPETLPGEPGRGDGARAPVRAAGAPRVPAGPGRGARAGPRPRRRIRRRGRRALRRAAAADRAPVVAARRVAGRAAGQLRRLRRRGGARRLPRVLPQPFSAAIAPAQQDPIRADARAGPGALGRRPARLAGRPRRVAGPVGQRGSGHALAEAGSRLRTPPVPGAGARADRPGSTLRAAWTSSRTPWAASWASRTKRSA